MSKYDFDLDLSENSSTGLILSKIKHGSSILEFGCANGRMTRYMKEELGCRVYIVEYDKPAYEEAVKYAADGLCEDILAFNWVEKFAGHAFDAILFADVLEHLPTPELVLTKAAELLTETGSIYISIPNITHNDILLKAAEEHFDYTRVGLLDDTHVHFWGRENLSELAEKCGLNVRKVEGTLCPTGCTEQYSAEPFGGSVLLRNILRERSCGEVYQFVVTMDRESASAEPYEFQRPFIESHVYVDTGKDFNEEERFDLQTSYGGDGSYLFRYVIETAGQVSRIRLDPVEGQDCILRQVKIQQGAETLLPMYHNAVALDNGVLLQGSDPFLYANTLLKDEPIVLEAEVILAGDRYIEVMRDMLAGKAAVCHVLQQETDRLRRENASYAVDNAVLRNEKAELERDVNSYIVLANNKDKWALELLSELERYRKFPSVRLHGWLTRFARKMYRTARRVAKGILSRLRART